jgi:hypothetical protein
MGLEPRILISGGTAEEAAEKIAEAQKAHRSAKARKHFRRFNGTTEVVPFPFVEKSEFFRKL